MPNPANSDLVGEARRLSEAATPGPWKAKEHYGPSDPDWWADHGDGPAMWMPEGLAWIDQDEQGRYMTQADAEFIARARTLLPELAQQLEQADRDRGVAYSRGWCDGLTQFWNGISKAFDAALTPDSATTKERSED